jgi:multiple sugar transport system substrate-binding protein
MLTKLSKLILATTLVCVMTLMFGQAALAQKKEVVRFLNNETDPPSVTFYNKAIAEFEKLNPNITVEMELVSTDARLQKVVASLSSKTMPGVFKLLAEERFQFARKGYLAPLDDLVKEIGSQDFVEGSVVKVDGKVYDLPYTLGNFNVLWYRDDLLKAAGIQPPKNWDELRSAAKALTKGDQYGFVFPAGKNRMTSIYLSTLMWSAGGTYFDKNFNITFNNPGTVAALRFLKEMAEYSPKGISAYSYSDMINSYLTGKVAIDIYAPRLIASGTLNAPDLAAKTSASSMPVGPSGVGVKFLSVNSYAVASPSVGGKTFEASKKFLKYILTGDRVRDFSLTVFPHLIPPMKSVQQKVIEAGVPQIGGRKELATISYNTSNSLDFESEAGAIIAKGQIKKSGVINPYIGAVIARAIPAEVVQKVVIEGEDPEKAAAWGAEEMKRVVDDLRKK